jgi:hypothetical protein
MNPKNELSDRRSEAGETLIEVLLSSALMALVVVAIIGGITTMVLGSSIHRDQTEANPALVSAMEDLKSPATARKCPVGAAPLPAYTLPADVSIKKIEYQVAGTGGTAFTWSDAASACDDTPASGPGDTGTPDSDNPMTLQRITLQYTHPGGTNVDPELQFIKGDH